MFYCYCKLWNSETKEQWIFGRWYKDGHYNDIPKALIRKANKIKEYRKDEPEYNKFSLSYNCVKYTEEPYYKIEREWYQNLYNITNALNSWKCIGLI